MNSLQTAAQQALVVVEAIREADTAGATPKMVVEARKMYEPTITALRAALAEPVLAPAPGYCKHCKQYTIEEPLPAEPVEEPVAWSYELATTRLDHGYDGWIHRITQHKPNVPEGSVRNLTPLYAAPPQRKPLTEEEIDGLMQSIGLRCADDGNERMANHAEWERRQRRRIARAIEQAHEIR